MAQLLFLSFVFVNNLMYDTYDESAVMTSQNLDEK